MNEFPSPPNLQDGQAVESYPWQFLNQGLPATLEVLRQVLETAPMHDTHPGSRSDYLWRHRLFELWKFQLTHHALSGQPVSLSVLTSPLTTESLLALLSGAQKDEFNTFLGQHGVMISPETVSYLLAKKSLPPPAISSFDPQHSLASLQLTPFGPLLSPASDCFSPYLRSLLESEVLALSSTQAKKTEKLIRPHTPQGSIENTVSSSLAKRKNI